MVRQCYVCKKLDSFNQNLSFHLFPSNIEERKIWFSLIGIEKDAEVPVRPLICSSHFDQSDILAKANGTKYIKRGAYPLVSHEAFNLVSSSSSSTVGETPPKKTKPELQQVEELMKVLDSSNSESEKNVVQMMHKDPSSSATLTASESEVERNTLYHQDIAGPSSSITKSLNPKKVIKRKRGFIAEMESSDFSTPTKRRKNLNIIKAKVERDKIRIRSLQQSVRRLKNKIVSLKSLLEYFKEKSFISDGAESTILASATGPARDLFERMLKGPCTQKYKPELRSFALTLAFYSPRAYNFVRNTFNKSLPHLTTLSKWYMSVDGSPGFTSESITALQSKVESSDHPVLCNLVMDEMAIRRQVEWTGKKFCGLVDIGTKFNSDKVSEAREALVFMVVCINGHWKLPVGYFLIDGLTAEERAEIVRKCLDFLHQTGIRITSLTFDGAPVNFSMIEKLGADFNDPSNLKTHFDHPITKKPVYILPDACHMIKLIRNCLASTSNLKNGKGEDIKWEYISELVQKQYVEGLQAATKLKLRHIQWTREKMKVRLATQTLSKSVSDALNFLREDLNCPEFRNSKATSDFILQFNNLFDIFNSRNAFSKYFFKRPLSASTSPEMFKFLDSMKDYILTLTLNSVPITKSGRQTGFLGFLILIKSLKHVYEDLIQDQKVLKYLLTYKFSQDHLELFFGTIRSRGGFNNNPTARQFEAAYKRLLIHAEISAPNTGNAANLDNISILTCSSSNTITSCDRGESLENNTEYLMASQKIQEDMNENSYIDSEAWNLTPYVEDVVSYIAGYVVKGIKKFITCFKCLNLLEGSSSLSLLQRRKTYGSLVMASEWVIMVCREGERFFLFYQKTNNLFNNKNKTFQILINQTVSNLPISVFNEFGDHFYDQNILDGHAIQLIKLILKSYFHIRLNHETRKLVDTSKKFRSRSIFTKTILFRNE